MTFGQLLRSERERAGKSLREFAREITAQAMVGKVWAKGDARGLTYEQALDAIDAACSKRDAKDRAA